MIALDQVSIVIHFSIGSFLIWLLIFFGGRDLRNDSLRQKLFALRDELFDYAADGNIDFGDPAYRLLRNFLNGTIRFAHKFSLLRLLMMKRITNARPEMVKDNLASDLEVALKKLPEEKQYRLQLIMFQVVRTILIHAVFSSTLLPFFIALWVKHRAVERVKRFHTRDKYVSPFSDHFRPSIVGVEAALEEEERHEKEKEQVTVPV